MMVENISRPGQTPAEGDVIRITTGSAVTVKEYHEQGALPAAPLSKFAFMQRFTQAELVGIFTAAKTDVAVEVWLKLLDAATTIELDHPQTIAGLNALVTAGLLTQQRAEAILA